MGTLSGQLARYAAGGFMVVLTTVSAACGGGNNEVSGGEFASRVNALCKAEGEQVDALFDDFPAELTAKDMQELVREFTPIISQYRSDVLEVGAPKNKGDEYRRYVELLDEAVDRYEAASEDPALAETLFNEDDSRLADAERPLGLDTCASR